MIYLMIVAMGLVVFFNRYLFIEPRLPVRLNRGAREFWASPCRACSRRSAGRLFFWLTIGLT